MCSAQVAFQKSTQTHKLATHCHKHETVVGKLRRKAMINYTKCGSIVEKLSGNLQFR